MSTETTTARRELDARSFGGISVQLLWEPATDQTFIAVADATQQAEYPVPAAIAAEAFLHPYAFAPRVLQARPREFGVKR